MEIISLDSDATGQLLIIYSAFVIYFRKKWEYTEAVHQLFIAFKKTYDSVRREVLCNMLIEFGVLMKLVRLITLCLSETSSRRWVGKNLSDSLLIRNGLKQTDALSLLLLHLAFRRVPVNQNGLKLSGTHQLLVYADDVNIYGGSAHTIKNIDGLVVASKVIGLEANADKTLRCRNFLLNFSTPYI